MDDKMTPGQAACIAWNAHYAEEHGITARNEWAASDARGRAAWEAAAEAGSASLRDALQQVAKHIDSEHAQLRIAARIAKRALDA